MQAVKNKTISLLRWAERYTKTDMVYLAHGGFWLTLGQLLVFAASAVLVWIFANFLPKEIYGQYRFLTSAAAIFGLATLPGVNTAIVQTVARGASGTARPAIRTQIKWGTLGTLGSLVLAGYYGFNHNLELMTLFILVALFIPFYDSFNLYHQYLQGQKDFRRDALYWSVQRTVVVVAVGASVIFTSNIFVIVAALLASSSITDFILWRRALRVYPPNTTIDEGAITYGKQLSLISAVRIGAQYLDKLLLWYFAGPIQVATYAIAAAPPQELTSVVAHVNRLALPKMSAQERSGLQKSLLRKVGIYFLFLLPVVISYILAAPFIFSFFFPQYLDAVPYTQLLTLLMLFIPSGLLTQYFFATKNLRALNTLNVVEPALLLSLYATLIPFFGIYGVIFASLGRSFGSTLVLTGFFLRDKASPSEHPSLSQ